MERLKMKNQKFRLGNVVITQGVASEISDNDLGMAIRRHSVGDWGDICSFDREVNEDALINIGRLKSNYKSSSGVEFWIITEWDRSATTILLPSEY
jgi:hypothetical protein